MAKKSKRRDNGESAQRLSPGQMAKSRVADPTKGWVLGWILLLGPMSIVLFLLIFSDLPWLAEQTSQGALNAADKLLSAGRDRMREGNSAEAYALFQKALQIKPDHAVTQALLGQVCYSAGELDQALVYLKNAIALNPPQKDLYYNNLGILYGQKGQLDTALVMFGRALGTGVKTANIYENIGLVYMAQKDYSAAVQAFTEAIEHRPNLESLYLEMLRNTLTDFLHKEDQQEASQTIRAILQQGVSAQDLAIYDPVIVQQYIQNTPKMAGYYKNLGEAYKALGNLTAAEQSYQQALKIYPNYAPARQQLEQLH